MTREGRGEGELAIHARGGQPRQQMPALVSYISLLSRERKGTTPGVRSCARGRRVGSGGGPTRKPKGKNGERFFRPTGDARLEKEHCFLKSGGRDVAQPTKEYSFPSRTPPTHPPTLFGGGQTTAAQPSARAERGGGGECEQAFLCLLPCHPLPHPSPTRSPSFPRPTPTQHTV